MARRYADEHLGTIALDLDALAGRIGGWREDFSAALEQAPGLWASIRPGVRPTIRDAAPDSGHVVPG